MTASETLAAVLDRIDRDLDGSLDRLFALLRIQSVSTDPAYAAQCRKAAEHVAADLRSFGFETSVRPTEGHPIVIGKAGNGKTDNNADGRAPRVLFYGHYDVQPVSYTHLDVYKRQSPTLPPSAMNASTTATTRAHDGHADIVEGRGDRRVRFCLLYTSPQQPTFGQLFL